MTNDEPERLTFPCDYPVKVMVRAEPGVRSRVDAIVASTAGPLDLSKVTERSSAQDHVIRATGEAQIAALFAALKLCPQVLLVL